MRQVEYFTSSDSEDLVERINDFARIVNIIQISCSVNIICSKWYNVLVLYEVEEIEETKNEFEKHENTKNGLRRTKMRQVEIFNTRVKRMLKNDINILGREYEIIQIIRLDDDNVMVLYETKED